MVNSSKVLTVSYGTFSCTLEGFDDSFDTMKAIAEYFRDLAADDRYFGAEPPTPDADMLARIAEREVSRRVEAHQDGGNIVLRTALPVAETVIDKAEADLALDEANAKAEADAQEQEQARLAEIAEQDAIAEAEAEAERLRLEEEAQQAAKEAEAQERAEAEAAEQQAALEKADAEAKAAEQAKRDAQAADIEAARIAQEAADAEAKAEAQRIAYAEAEAQRVAEAEAEAAAQAEAARIAEEAAQKNEDEQPEPDSVAAKLARIRAVVGQPVDTPATPDFSEDEHADDIMQGQPGDTDLEDILELDDDGADSASDADTATADAISGVMAKLNADRPEGEASDIAAEASEELESVALEAELEAEEAVEAEDVTAVDLAPIAQDVAPQEPPKAPIRARVIKMKREEFEAAIASGDIEEDSSEDDMSAAPEIAHEPVQDTSLSRDDEDELARELAAVEAELAGLPMEDSVEEPFVEEEARFEPIQDLEVEAASLTSARGIDDLAPEPDVEMDRLMDQASSELEEPDGKKRRNALGHLRAAVASARADKKVRPEDAQVDETLEYRDDLESAVQPRRPVRRLSASDTPATTARPPLKLVAEQRVDSQTQEQAAPAQVAADAPAPKPVRPRRIKAGATPPPAPTNAPQDAEFVAESGSFNEFAEEMGATELPDLLEAAAAYLAYVEGKDQFSRPQLMTKVRMVQEDNFSREDGLRSFGQLLRQGKIEKISGGRFTVSDRISFKPDTRAVG